MISTCFWSVRTIVICLCALRTVSLDSQDPAIHTSWPRTYINQTLRSSSSISLACLPARKTLVLIFFRLASPFNCSSASSKTKTPRSRVQELTPTKTTCGRRGCRACALVAQPRRQPLALTRVSRPCGMAMSRASTQCLTLLHLTSSSLPSTSKASFSISMLRVVASSSPRQMGASTPSNATARQMSYQICIFRSAGVCCRCAPVTTSGLKLARI